MNSYSVAYSVLGIELLIFALYGLEIKQDVIGAIFFGLLATMSFILAKSYLKE